MKIQACKGDFLVDKRAKTVKAVREFNRFYTVSMGLLGSEYLGSEYSVAETRVLFEIMTSGGCSQSDIVKLLKIDKGYLCRTVNKLGERGLLSKEKSPSDKRSHTLILTERGMSETKRLVELTNMQIREKLSSLCEDDCESLVKAFGTIIEIFKKGDGLNAGNRV